MSLEVTIVTEPQCKEPFLLNFDLHEKGISVSTAIVFSHVLRLHPEHSVKKLSNFKLVRELLFQQIITHISVPVFIKSFIIIMLL